MQKKLFQIIDKQERGSKGEGSMVTWSRVDLYFIQGYNIKTHKVFIADTQIAINCLGVTVVADQDSVEMKFVHFVTPRLSSKVVTSFKNDGNRLPTSNRVRFNRLPGSLMFNLFKVVTT